MPELRAPFFTAGIAVGVLLPFVAPILAAQGFSPEAIGLLLAVASLVIVAGMPALGHLADGVLGRRRALVLVALLSLLAAVWAGPPIAPAVVAVAFVVWYLLQMAFPTMLDSVAMAGLGSRRVAYGRLRLLSSVAYSVAAVAAGVLYDRTGYAAAWPVYVAATAAFVVLVRTLAPRGAAPAPQPGPEAEPRAGMGASRPAARLGSVRAVVEAAPDLPLALAAMLLASVGLISASTFLPLRLHDLGAAPSVVAASAAVSAAFEIPAMLWSHRFIARLGLRGFFVIGCLMYALASLSWAFVDDPVLLVASRAATGIGYGALIVSSVVALGAMLPERLQTSGQSVRQSAISLVAVAAYTAGGFVYGLLGPAVFFALAALGPLGAAAIAWRALPARVPRPLDPAVRGLPAALAMDAPPGDVVDGRGPRG